MNWLKFTLLTEHHCNPSNLVGIGKRGLYEQMAGHALFYNYVIKLGCLSRRETGAFKLDSQHDRNYSLS